MVPQFSEAAKAAIPHLSFKAYSLLVFFEDEGCEYLYEELLKRLGAPSNLVRTICLNGKDSLIKFRQAPHNQDILSKCLFVLDKDFDDLLARQLRHDDVVYLSRYSIENHLLDHGALNYIASEEQPGLRNVAEILDLDGFIRGLHDEIIRLTSVFLVCQEFDLPLANTAESVARWCRDRCPWELDASKIAAYRQDAEELLVLLDEAASENDLADIFATRLARLSLNDVPGKHLLNLYKSHMGNKLDLRGLRADSLSFRLARHCNLESLENLRNAIAARVSS